MTDREVQKLGRRDLLELLLETQEENEHLSSTIGELEHENGELRTTVSRLQVDLTRSRSDDRAESRRQRDPAPYESSHEDSGRSSVSRADLLAAESLNSREFALQEQIQALWKREQQILEREQHARELDTALAGRSRELSAREHRLVEEEARIERRFSDQEAQIRRLLDDAGRDASVSRRQVEETNAESLRQAGAAADRIIQEARENASRIEEKAAADAELILQRAQDDSRCFWEDMTALLEKQMTLLKKAPPGRF